MFLVLSVKGMEHIVAHVVGSVAAHSINHAISAAANRHEDNRAFSIVGKEIDRIVNIVGAGLFDTRQNRFITITEFLMIMKKRQELDSQEISVNRDSVRSLYARMDAMERQIESLKENVNDVYTRMNKVSYLLLDEIENSKQK